MAVPNVLTENNKEELATGDLIGHWVGITSGYTGKEKLVLVTDVCVYDRIQNKVPKNKFGRHGTTRGLQTNKIGTVLCLARCVIFNIVKGQLCPQSLCGWIGDCPGNERD